MKWTNQLSDFVDDISNQTDAVVCGHRLTYLFGQYGAHASNIWIESSLEGKIYGTYPEDWRNHIYKMEWAEKTHVFQQSKRSMTPIFWGMDITPSDPKKNKYGEYVIQSAYDSYGAKSAVTFPVHGYYGRQYGGVSFVTKFKKNIFNRLLLESGTLLQSASIVAHLKIQNLLESAPLETFQKLSARETECVYWLTQGLRTKQIAERLSLSNVAVNLYLQNAKRKFGARTREQLVSMAILSKNIVP